MTHRVRLGLRENAAQFSLLVAVNAFTNLGAGALAQRVGGAGC